MVLGSFRSHHRVSPPRRSLDLTAKGVVGTRHFKSTRCAGYPTVDESGP